MSRKCVQGQGTCDALLGMHACTWCDTVSAFLGHVKREALNCSFTIIIQHANEVRYQLFRDKKGDLESSQLPPCKDCLHMHRSLDE